MDKIAKVFIFLYPLLLLSILIFLSIITEGSLFVVVISFFPSLIAILIISSFLDRNHDLNHFLLYGTPIILSALYFIIVSAGLIPFLLKTDYLNIAISNLLLGMVFSILLSLVTSNEHANKHPHKKAITPTAHHTTMHTMQYYQPVYQQQHQIKKPVEKPKKEIGEYIQSIEDKSKAINFAIGRVYSDKHGGTSKIRDSIRINKEWYNAISGIGKTIPIKRVDEIKKVIRKISERFYFMSKTEEEVFGDDCKKLINIQHNPQGKDKIIDVLIKNDKDPVKTYYQSAIEFCSKALEQLDYITPPKKE